MKDGNRQTLNNAAVAIRAVVLLTATIMTRVRMHAAPATLGLDILLVCGGLYVLLTSVLDRLGPRYRPDVSALVGLDVFYITALVWQTGGLASEFYLLYYLPILHASVRLDFRHAVLSSMLAALCYGLITVAGGPDVPVQSTPALQLATFGGSALILALFFATAAALSRSQRETTDRLERTVERLSALYRVARAVHAKDSLQSVVDTSLELGLELTGARFGYVALGNGAGELLVKASRAASSQGDIGEHPPFDRRLAEQCLVRRAPVVTDVRGDHPEVAGALRARCCVISVPLVHNDNAYGAVQLYDAPGETCGERELETLVALCGEASRAIENARLLAEVHRLAVTDELTGLYHRSEFRRLLAAEVDNARANGGVITVLLFDIDGMQQIGAEHGPEAADEVLLAFADMLRRYIRSQDIAARYGADEFAVLLPQGGIDGARAVAARLCHAMARHPFHLHSEDEVRHFSVCAGAVVAKEMPDDPDHLIGRADEALFEARQAGPGQIRFWEATVKRGVVTQMRQIVEHVQHSSDEQWR